MRTVLLCALLGAVFVLAAGDSVEAGDSLKRTIKTSYPSDARCARPPGFPGDTDFTIYSYQLPVVIFDDRTGQILAWGYGDACVKPVPHEGSPGGYKRTGDTLTSLVLDLDRNVTAGPLPGCTEPPAARPWVAGQDPRDTRRCFIRDAFSPAYPDARRQVKVPNANYYTFGPFPVPAEVGVGIPGTHRPLLEQAGVLVAPGWDDRAVPHCPAGGGCPDACQTDVTQCPPNVTRAWVEHLPEAAPRRYAKAFLHATANGLAGEAADRQFAFLLMERAHVLGYSQTGGVLSVFLFPAVRLGPLTQRPCTPDGQVRVDGTVVNQSGAGEFVDIRYSWDGQNWRQGPAVWLEPYQTTPFTLSVPSPARPGTLRVQFRPRAGGALVHTDDPSDNTAALGVQPCAPTCDLMVRIGELPAAVDQNGARVPVAAVKRNCPGVGLVPVEVRVAGRTRRLWANFDRSRGEQSRELIFDTGGLPLGSTVTLVAVIDPGDEVAEVREENNTDRADLRVREPEEYCPDPDACAGSDLTS